MPDTLLANERLLMTPYVRKFITDEEMALFEKVRLAVASMPDVDLGIDEKGEPVILSCHVLARAVAKVFSLQYVDGYFYRRYDHSWIETPSGNIIDIYPVAIIGGPIMMDGNNGMIAQQLYSPDSTRKISRGKFGRNSFRRAVRKTISALQQ